MACGEKGQRGVVAEGLTFFSFDRPDLMALATYYHYPLPLNSEKWPESEQGVCVCVSGVEGEDVGSGD